MNHNVLKFSQIHFIQENKPIKEIKVKPGLTKKLNLLNK